MSDLYKLYLSKLESYSEKSIRCKNTSHADSVVSGYGESFESKLAKAIEVSPRPTYFVSFAYNKTIRYSYSLEEFKTAMLDVSLKKTPDFLYVYDIYIKDIPFLNTTCTYVEVVLKPKEDYCVN